jgi:coenzyme Q-binding protein COQ10
MTIHEEKRIVPHHPAHLYELVADVKSYPEFLPWCKAARIRNRDDKNLKAELMVGLGFFRETFMSSVDLKPDDLMIDVSYTEGPFKSLTNTWVFKPHPEGCEIDFFVQFEFESNFFQSMMASLFSDAVKKMAAAFERRADTLYDRVS